MDGEVAPHLVCPVTKSKLRREGAFLVSEVGGLKYPIKDGIPVLLAGSAQLPPGYGTLVEFEAAFGKRPVGPAVGPAAGPGR
jgi:uncharacterized protein YbaR (Trm112 family)